jgi:hypothetical protein
MVAVGCRVNRGGRFAPVRPTFYGCGMSNLRDARRRDCWQVKRVAIGVAALLFQANAHVMAQSSGAKPELAADDVTIQATASSSGATLTIVPKSPHDESARAAVDAYGNLLAKQLPLGKMEPLFSLLPANPEIAKRLKENPAAFTVSHTGAMIRVELIASDQQSRAAIHDYLAPLFTEKATRSANHPGNNLGWDAARDADARK